ncbi:MAG TPA: hypothetical protein VFE47_03440 [Tepidisphaeraceae bacterium]|jgi:hypothetical protein|nr:hypothetical protein [Tepidisphaeraceae bacterium]
MDRLLLVGVEPDEISELRPRLDIPFVSTVTLPRIKVERGTLHVERPNAVGHFLPISKVVFHGIYENDFDFINALALWGGPCLPSADGMLDLRLRLPGLVRSLRVSRFNAMPRSFAVTGVSVNVDRESVSKWGNWHCGENKEKFTGEWKAQQATVIEDFVEGQAVRIVLIGDRPWQIHLTGETWKKSIHPDDAAYMPIDAELLEDTRRLRDHFKIDVIGVDYMIGNGGTKHLLEVNHIPNVTRFPEIRAAYLDLVAKWV